MGSALNKVKEAYLDSLVIDAGLIGDAQLQYFIALMRRIKAALGQRYIHLTKIATLHHHVSHLWDQQLEVKAFESVLDAAQLKRSLIENGFHFVLHGHKHTNHVGLDGSLIPLSEMGPFTPLCIISGGTVGGNPRINDRQTFKLLTLDGKKGPRTRAKVSEIAIREVGNYDTSINSDARVFNVPISQWLPPIQALDGALGLLDSVLVARLYLTLPVLHSLRDEYDPGNRDNALTDRIIELSQNVLSAFRDIMAGVLGLSAHIINCSVWLRSLSPDNVDASQISVSPLAFSNPFDGRRLEDHKVYESTIAAALSGLNDNAGNVWSPQQSQCFCCNALYSNNFATPTPKWEMFFNSVLAFPIRKRIRGNNRSLKDYGYLRFDAPEPGVFTNMPCAFQYKTEPWAYARRLEERPEFYLGGTMAHLLLLALDKPGAVLDEVSNAA